MRQDSADPTVLVVDDDDGIRSLMRKALEMNGCRVVEAKDGDEAVGVARQETPRLILMDIGLPQRSGISATYRIRNHPELRAVTIVAVTAYDSPALRDDALKAGCDDHLIKPINIGQLKDILNRFMRVLDQPCLRVALRPGLPGDNLDAYLKKP